MAKPRAPRRTTLKGWTFDRTVPAALIRCFPFFQRKSDAQAIAKRFAAMPAPKVVRATLTLEAQPGWPPRKK